MDRCSPEGRLILERDTDAGHVSCQRAECAMLESNTEQNRVLLFGTSECPKDSERLGRVPAVRNNLRELKECFQSISRVKLFADRNLQTSMLEQVKAFCAEARGVLLVYYGGHGLLNRHQNTIETRCIYRFAIPLMQTTVSMLCRLSG